MAAGTAAPGLRLAIVTNIPAPYRVPVYNRIAATPNIVLRAFYAARSEPDRGWDLPPFEHDHVFLSGSMHERGGRFIHYNPDIWRRLREFRPDVIVTTGYNPTHLIAFLFARLHRCRHVVMTDGTDRSEARLTWLHRWVRRTVFAGSAAFVTASLGGWRLLRSYGVADHRIHFSPLCANTAVDWQAAPAAGRDIDLLFSGRLVDVKNAGFALAVAQDVARRLNRRVRLALLGHGPLEAALRAQAAAMAAHVDVIFAGHVPQAAIPGWFLRARVFLFPTQWDPWGVVANEACMAAVPVIVSPHAGAAGELILDGVNGFVLPLALQPWSDAAQSLLCDPVLHARMSQACGTAVAPYSFDNAALGIVDAAIQAHAQHVTATRLSHYRRRAQVSWLRPPDAGAFARLSACLRRWNVDLVDAPAAWADLVIGAADTAASVPGSARWILWAPQGARLDASRLHQVHWAFADSPRAVGALLDLGLPAERVSLLQPGADGGCEDWAHALLAALAAPAD